MSRKLAPIAFFAFNRPEHTKRALESLAANPLAAQSELFIFCDGPRREDDRAAVAKVQQIAGASRWCGKVNVLSSDKNRGCAESIIYGVTKLCADYGQVIVIEDDLLLSPFFLHFLNDALDRYVNHAQVMQISGYMFPIQTNQDVDAHFLPFTSSWGWATWARAWKHLDTDMQGYRILKSNTTLRKQFDLNGAYPYFDMLRAQREGTIDSWAIRWYLGTFLAGGLTLFPRQSLVENIGFDGSGTHCKQRDRNDKIQDTFEVNTFPNTISPNKKVTTEIEAFLANINSKGPTSLTSRLRRFFS